MDISTAREARATAALARADMRDDAATYGYAKSDLRRDQRVEEAKDAAATRPAPKDNAVPRDGKAMFIDLLA